MALFYKFFLNLNSVSGIETVHCTKPKLWREREGEGKRPISKENSPVLLGKQLGKVTFLVYTMPLLEWSQFLNFKCNI